MVKPTARGTIDHYELDSSSDDGHLSAAAKTAAANRLVEDLESASTVTDPDCSSPNSPDPKKSWSSESEIGPDVYANFKDRQAQSRKRKRPVATKPKISEGTSSTTRRSAKTAKPSIVGRRPRKKQKREKIAKEPTQDTSSDEDEDKIEAALPDYLKKRRVKFEENRRGLEQAGLRLPPVWKDNYFSEDEGTETGSLTVRPVFDGGVKPCAAYKDVELPYSSGVVPAPVATWLRDYQVQGASFLHEMFVWQKGGILGDDMGLGKTIQVIAFLTAAFGKSGDSRDAKRMRKIRRAPGSPWYPRVLVICPGTVMENWRSEFDRWGWWHIETYHGAAADKEAALQAAHTGRLEVMITTYTTYRLNRSQINLVEWDCVIADECHQMKERRSEISKAMNEVNALCRIGLTGTAIQNNYNELWTLLNWTNPGRFGPISSWKKVISEPLKLGQSHDATQRELGKARLTATKLSQNLLPEFFMRRMKTLIADQLPKKSDRVVFCPLTDTQQDAYQNYVSSELVETIRESTQPCPCNSGNKSGWCCHATVQTETGRQAWQNYTFVCLEFLRRLSNHLATLIPTSSETPDVQSKALEHLKLALPNDWKQLYQSRDSILNYANQEFCGKWKILKKLLRFWHAAGDKVLVFSYSRRLLRMLQTLFISTTSYNVSYLDGSMSLLDRNKAVAEFNSSPSQFVFLISTRAGGVGLNITSANKVVVVDPNWNPSYDLQAQDRAYRIGQIRDVEVFRLISAGTIEEIVYARQIYKQQQANIGYSGSNERRYFKGVQDAKEKKGEIFGLQNLFCFHGDLFVLRDIVNKTNVAESKAGVDVVGLDFESALRDGEADENPDPHDPFLPSRNPPEQDPDLRKEDVLMSQLDALVAGGSDPANQGAKSSAGTKKADPIQAILASAGVSYTHENAQVVGSSKVESRLSKRAQEAASHANAMHLIPESEDIRVFAGSQRDRPRVHQSPMEEDREEGDRARKYHPPLPTRQRQFAAMAAFFGYDAGTLEGITEFALVVEGWTQAGRRNALDKFYEQRGRESEMEEGDEL